MITKSEKKKLAEIREQWGKPKNINRNFNNIAGYLAIEGESYISSNTAADLDVDSLFEYIDRTSSKPGQQYLYKKLHQPDTSEDYFKTLEQNIAAVNNDKDLRERAQLKLSTLSNPNAYNLPQLFSKQQQAIFGQLISLYINIAPWLTPALIISLFIVSNQFAFLLAFAMVVANVTLHFINKFKMLSYTHSLPQLLILYNVSKWLADNGLIKKDNAIQTSLNNVTKLKQSLSFINIQNQMDNDPTDISYLISEWFKMFLAIEPLIFIYSISRVNKYLTDIKTLYEATAKVDMAISIQSVREGAPRYCLPNFSSASQTISVEDIYHPLIERCITNSITIDNKHGVLVTGSNMSGKTTFIRSVAINVLLAQTINTSFATSYSAPLLKILTSIDISDSLDDSKSYFQTEALAVKNIIDEVANAKPINSLVIIDEIFRGTNTIERIAAAKAVLTYLVANNSFVFVSTHDLELAELLGVEYKVFSFEEQIGDNRLVFDYKIKEGLLKNKNGIAILKGMGYPDSIIDDATKVNKQLRDKYRL
jgi:DNA mismatch repair ATPase MutS